MPTTKRRPSVIDGMYGHCMPWNVSHSDPCVRPRVCHSGYADAGNRCRPTSVIDAGSGARSASTTGAGPAAPVTTDVTGGGGGGGSGGSGELAGGAAAGAAAGGGAGTAAGAGGAPAGAGVGSAARAIDGTLTIADDPRRTAIVGPA